MVEIKRETTDDQSTRDGAKYRLIYTKSKVYINPTAYARDNIPGFVAIVKRVRIPTLFILTKPLIHDVLQEVVTETYLLAWIPEALLTEKGQEEWDKFLKTEERPDEDEGMSRLVAYYCRCSSRRSIADGVLIDLPTPRPESYAFSVPLSSVYSLIVQPPSLSSWRKSFLCLLFFRTRRTCLDGSIGINLISGSTLPTLYFHDDESHSFTIPSKSSSSSNSSTSYPPPPSLAAQAATGRPITSWGGEDFLSRLRSYASLLRSNLQSTLYLVDPSKADIEVHSTQLFSDDAVDEILARSSYTNSHSPVPAHRRPRPLSTGGTPPNPYSQYSSVLHRSMPIPPSNPGGSSQARAALLQSFANITRATRHAAQNILSHPLAKPIVPHLPDPVKSLVSANGDLEWGSWVEKGGVGEFESARVYLARWARIVAEEGERARRREAQAIPANAAASTAEESGELGIFELLHSTANLPTPKSTRDPTHPVGVEVFNEWSGPDGRPLITMERLRMEIFRRGVSDKDNARRRLWPYLLGVYAWDVTQDERQRLWEAKMWVAIARVHLLSC